MTRALYVAVLNDDAFLELGWLEALLKVMEADPEIVACAGLMVFDPSSGDRSKRGDCHRPDGYRLG